MRPSGSGSPSDCRNTKSTLARSELPSGAAVHSGSPPFAAAGFHRPLRPFF
jgi:hypothetical protein